MDVLHHVHLLEVDRDDLVASSLSKGETSGDRIDHIHLLGALEDGPASGALLSCQLQPNVKRDITYTNRAHPPNTDHIAVFDLGVDDRVV